MQYYGKESQLFYNELDMLNGLFNSLPAPPPSRSPVPPSYNNIVVGCHVT